MSSTAGPPYQMSSRREHALCFFYSVLLAAGLGRPQLTARCPSASGRPICSEVLSQRFAWPQARHARHVMSGVARDKGKALSASRGSSPELEQTPSFKFVPHRAVTTAPFPSEPVRHCRCSILAAALVGAPHRKKTVGVLWTCLCTV